MSSRSGPDDVATPASDAMVFTSAPWLIFLVIFVTVIPVATVFSGLLDVADGASLSWPTVRDAADGSLLYALPAAGVAAWLTWYRRTWIRTSSGGMEIATYGGDPILLGWSDIVSAQIRRRGLGLHLDVVPVDLDTVRSVEPRHDLPPLRDTPAGPAFTIQIRGLSPGQAALRAELARRVPDGC